MLGRLTTFDLAGGLQGRLPGPLVQVFVGVLLAGVAFLARVLLQPLAPQAVPFALLYPAVLVATGLAGSRAGAVALSFGGLLSWYFLLPPHPGWALDLGGWVSLGVFLVAGSMVIVAASAYRATALALRDSQERLDLATSAAKVGVWEWRLATGEMIYSDEAKRICGFPLDRPVTLEMTETIIHPDDRGAISAKLARARDPTLRDEGHYEYRILWPSGEVRWVQARGRMLFDLGNDGRSVAVRYVGALQDVTARKIDEERLRLLAREVDHRANNLMAVVQGTVALSEADDSAALKSVITGRVNALARAHQLLAQARWEGADLRRLVEEELLAFSLGDEARVAVHGPPVSLAPPAAQSLAMALHELATNAAKYGALSVSSGRVEVSWTRDDAGALSLCWREIGGPAVRKPSRKGLGTTLLERALAGPIRGATVLDWRGEGLVCKLVLPATALEGGEPPDGALDEPVTAAEPRPQSAR